MSKSTSKLSKRILAFILILSILCTAFVFSTAAASVETPVSTPAELIDALAAGETAVLINDITVTVPLTYGEISIKSKDDSVYTLRAPYINATTDMTLQNVNIISTNKDLAIPGVQAGTGYTLRLAGKVSISVAGYGAAASGANANGTVSAAQPGEIGKSGKTAVLADMIYVTEGAYVTVSGQNGQRGGNGGNGSASNLYRDASYGRDGGAGGTAIEYTGEIIIGFAATLSATGGDGGRGGDGGIGATRTAPTATPGDGGAAGNGGSSAAAIVYSGASSDPTVQVYPSAFLSVAGGNGGRGGNGGASGKNDDPGASALSTSGGASGDGGIVSNTLIDVSIYKHTDAAGVKNHNGAIGAAGTPGPLTHTTGTPGAAGTAGTIPAADPDPLASAISSTIFYAPYTDITANNLVVIVGGTGFPNVNVIPSYADVEYEYTAPAGAGYTVDATGEVTGVTEGIYDLTITPKTPGLAPDAFDMSIAKTIKVTVAKDIAKDNVKNIFLEAKGSSNILFVGQIAEMIIGSDDPLASISNPIYRVDAPDAGIISVDEAGVVRALAPGEAAVEVWLWNDESPEVQVYATYKFIVYANPTELSFLDSELTVVEGTTGTLLTKFDTVFPIVPTLEFTSSDPLVVDIVPSTGAFSAWTVGESIITCITIVNGVIYRAQCLITVIPEIVGQEYISVFDASFATTGTYIDNVVMAKNDAFFVFTEITGNGPTLAGAKSTEQGVTWHTSDPEIAIYENGMIKSGSKEGVAEIKVSSALDSSIFTVFTVKVKKDFVAVDAIVVDNITMGIGDMMILNPTILPSNASQKPVFALAPTSDPAIAYIDSATGLIEAYSEGIVWMSVTVGPKTAVFYVEVVGSVQVTAIGSIADPTWVGGAAGDAIVTLFTDGVYNLSWEVIPSSANKGVTFKSSRPDYVSVTKGGQVKGLKAGASTITITSVDDPTKSDTVLVIVADDLVLPADIKMDEHIAINAGGTTQIKYSVVAPDGKTVNMFGTPKFTASSTDITVDAATGILTASDAAVGKDVYVEMTYTLDAKLLFDMLVNNAGWDPDTAKKILDVVLPASKEITKVINVHVFNDVRATGINVDIDHLDMWVGEYDLVTATVEPAGTVANPGVIWMSDKPWIASVVNGVVVAQSPGTAVISAISADRYYVATTTVTVTDAPVEVEGVSAEKLTMTLFEGDTSQVIKPIFTPSNASNKKVTYLSDDDSIAEVYPNGTIKAVSEGTTFITITTDDGGHECVVVVTVIDVPEFKNLVLLAPANVELNVGNTYGTPYEFNETLSWRPIVWRSTNEEFATVDWTGKVTAIAVGTTTITAQCAGDIVHSYEVEVTAAPIPYVPVTGVTAGSRFITMNKGEDGRYIRPIIIPANATFRGVTYKSLKDTIASIDADGVITAHDVGTTDIIITTVDGFFEYTVTVTVLPVFKELLLKVGSDPVVIQTGHSFNTPYEFDDSRIIKPIFWSSSNQNVAFVDWTGKVTAVAVGTTIITANVEGNLFQYNVEVTQAPILPTALTVNPSRVTIEMKSRYTVVPVISPATTTDKNKLTFMSTDTSIFEIDPDTGVITPKNPGFARVIVETGNNIRAAVDVYVVEIITVSGVEIDADNNGVGAEAADKAMPLLTGKAATLHALFPDSANPGDYLYPTNKMVFWSSSNPSVASVDANGVVTALTAGETVITVTTFEGHFTASMIITVTDSPVIPTAITLSPKESTITADQTQRLTVTFIPATATETRVRFYSSDDTVATVNNHGKVTPATPAKAGTVTITAVAIDAPNSVLDTAIVHVTNPIAVEDITLTPADPEIEVGETIDFVIQFNQTSKSGVPDDRTVTWSSDNPTLGTVDQNGHFTALKETPAGTKVKVTAKALNDVIGEATVTIGPATVLVKGVTIAPGSVELDVNLGSYAVAATVYPLNATNKNVKFTSSNDAVVEITNKKTGAFKINGLGIAYITVETEDGNYTATAEIKIVANKITGIVLNPATITLDQYQSSKIHANIIPSGTIMKDVIWTTSNANKVTVDENGYIFAKDITAAGAPVTITATAKDDSSISATCEVTVVGRTVTGVVLYPTVKVLDLEKDINGYTMVWQVLPVDAPDNEVTFSTSNASVANVNAKTGVVTPKGLGSAVITVTTKNGKTAKATIVVVNNLKSLTLDPNAIQFNMYDGPKTLKVEIDPPAATNKDDLVWTSSDTGVARVVNGVVYPVGKGKAVITVSTIDGVIKDTCQVQVIGDNDYITMSKDYYKDIVGSGMKLTSKSHSLDDADFVSGNKNVAKVDADGFVKLVGVGKTIIYINKKDQDSGHILNGFVEIEVIQEASKIEVTKEITTTVSRSVSIEHQIIPATTTDKTIKWTSDKPAIATVSSEGVVTPHKSGTAYITAKTVYGGVYATCLIVVREDPAPALSGDILNTHITIFRNQVVDVKGLAKSDDESLTYETADKAITVTKYGIVKGRDIGEGLVSIKDATGKVIRHILVDVTFRSDVETDPASTKVKAGESVKIQSKLTSSDPDAQLNWTSSDSSVAYVDQQGNVTGLKSGTVVITATADDGSGQYDQTVIFISGADQEKIKNPKTAEADFTPVLIPVAIAFVSATLLFVINRRKEEESL